MPAKTSPFLGVSYGDALGASGWNQWMDENLLKFSYLFDGSVDAIVTTLPAIVNGSAYFLSTDNRIYFAVDGVYYSTSVPKWFTFKIKSNGNAYLFNGSAAVSIKNNQALASDIQTVQNTIGGYGTAVTKNTEFFASLAQLNAASTSANSYADSKDVTNLAAAKVYTDALASTLDADNGAAGISFRNATLTNSVRVGLEGMFTQVINARYFGMLGDGSDVTTQMQQLRDAAASSGKRIIVEFPAGDYKCSTWPNWAIRGLAVRCLGEVFFTNTGTGYTLILDGGATAGQRVDDFSIGSRDCPLIVRGGANTGGGIYVRAVLTSEINVRCYGCGTAAAALRTEWAVLVNFNVRVGPGDMTTGTAQWYQGGKPGAGYSLGQRLTGEQTAYCRFDFPFVAACSVGIYLDSTLGNLFIGGDSEYNTNQGLLTTPNALNDLFIKTNFEVNGTDMNITGKYLEFIGCDSVSAVISSGAKNIQLKGGNWDAITIQSGALDTYIGDVKYGRGLSGNGIVDNGTRTRFANNFNLNTGKGENAPKGTAVITVGASPFDYTNTTGNPVVVTLAGGTGLTISYVTESGAVNAIGSANGQFYLLPSDKLRIAYTAAPTAIMYKGF
jgi:hypothetical protein